MIVVDTNIIAYYLLTSERTDAARRLFAHDPEWAAPLLWRSEFCNILTAYVRKDLAPLTHLEQILKKALELMRGREYQVVPGHVLTLAARSACSAYDCEFVALAEEMNLTLVTADRRLAMQFPERALLLDRYLDIEIPGL